MLTRLGRPDEARQQYDLVEYIGRLYELNQILYNRELAYLLPDHDMKLDAALALARRELDVRRDVYAHDLLAWALLKNGQPRQRARPWPKLSASAHATRACSFTPG